MASIITLAPENEALAAAFRAQVCAYCRSPIASGERWVREKIYERFSCNRPRYRRYHADLFGDAELSCWEKRQLELEIAKTGNSAA